MCIRDRDDVELPTEQGYMNVPGVGQVPTSAANYKTAVKVCKIEMKKLSTNAAVLLSSHVDRPGFVPPPPVKDDKGSSSDSDDGFPKIETEVEDLATEATTTKAAAVKVAASPGAHLSMPIGPTKQFTSSGDLFLCICGHTLY